MKVWIFIISVFLGSHLIENVFGQSNDISLKQGLWQAELKSNSGVAIPFRFQVISKGKQTYIEILNANERLRVDEIKVASDSVFITLPFFDSEFRVQSSGNELNGFWIRHLPGRSVRMPFHAKAGNYERFDLGKKPAGNVSGTWDINFSKSDKPSLGEFSQLEDGKVSGSILNLDGDYRFLEGRLKGDSLYLSTFDGSHALLFKARLNTSDRSLEGGKLYSGLSGISDWKGQFNPSAKLPDPYSLTSLKDGFHKVDFDFRNMKGKMVSLKDPQFKNKVIILQFMGSWCPNCMDETAFLSRFYDKFKDNVAIIGLAYERTSSFDTSRNSLQHFVKRFHVGYDILITGFTNKPEQVMKSIPALKNFMAFPTTIILDKQGNVNSIHTGFAGPGTGKYYSEFTEEFTQKIEELIHAE